MQGLERLPVGASARVAALLSGKTLAALLVAALAAQALVWEGWRTPALPTGPMPGSPVPDVAIETFDSRSPRGLLSLVADAENEGCTLLVIISPACPTCARMRVTWPDRFAAWADSVGVAIRPVWLSAGGGDALREFVRDHSLDGIGLAFFAPGTTVRAYDVLGVLGTPTLYLVGSEGIVHAGLVGDSFPPVDLARRACR